MNRLRITALLAGFASLATIGQAGAGGFDRGGVNIDLLFDPSKVATEAGVTYVSPQRTIKNVDRLPTPPPSLPDTLGITPSIKVQGDYTVPRAGFKMNVFEPVDCLATYTEPYGADANFGTGNAYSPTAVDYSIGTKDYGLTCSYKMDVGKGVARIIGGVSYGEVDAYLSRQTLLAVGNTGIGVFSLSDSAWSWRIGASYEIPEMALRASVLYNARYNYDGLSGTVDTTGFAGGPLGNFTGVDPVTASSEIPQAVEFRLQSGIAPGWLAFGSVKWQEWSKLGVIPINGVISPVFGTPSAVSFDLLYRDGWTVTTGVGHKFSETLSGVASVTWDRGTSTISGYQTDTWSVASGVSYTATENLEFRLGGSVGVMTGGTSSYSGLGDQANAVIYDFDADVVLAGTASIKLKF
ncbi:MAG: outer membrane protein transport protein [Mesorhizobium sp.]|nr:outer membrane protein transport protein [Mesorhizobium sp.]MBL8576166.1 outer membrane protein transport protein [Mesorhizobium sp.]